MQNEINPQPIDRDSPVTVKPVVLSGGKRVIQPGEAFRQEIPTQQIVEPQVFTPQTPQPINYQTTAAPVPMPQPQPSMPSQQFGQSNAIRAGKRQQRKKRLIVIGSIFTGLIALFAVFMVVMDSMYGLKAINFDNGNGTKFNMRFYKRYHIVSTDIKNKSTLKLVSKVSVSGKAPVAIYIDGGRTLVSDDEWQKSPNRNCSGSAPLAFSVYNTTANQDINLCLVSKNGEDELQYVGAMHYNSRIYPIVISQDIDLSGLSGNKEDPNTQNAAQTILDTAGLQVYKNDLTKIISSIKPLN